MQSKKRLRAKFTEPLNFVVSQSTNTQLEAILDAEIAKGRDGFTMSDLLREGAELVIAHYNPNGHNTRKDKPRRSQPAPPAPPKPKPKAKSSPKVSQPIVNGCDIPDCGYNKQGQCTLKEHDSLVCKKPLIVWMRLTAKRPPLNWDDIGGDEK
jgi:hypothetical protein